jgi:hypothetical protein
MTRVRLKGIDTAHKRLADGSIRTYFYAWRGGPRLVGEPGCADFVASYNDAIATRPTHHSGKTLATIVDAYLDSQDFTGKRDRTRADYRKITHRIVSEFGDMPIKVVEDRRTRGVFLEWRDRLAKQSKRQADYAFAVLALILAWAKNRGAIDSNPCERAGKVYSAARADKVWREDGWRRPSSRPPLAGSPWPSTWRFGPASGKEICWRSRGPHTTAPRFGCSRARPGGES